MFCKEISMTHAELIARLAAQPYIVMFAAVPWAIWSFGAESAEHLQQAPALLTDPEITVEQVAQRFGVGVSTLYRQSRGGRAEIGEAVRGA